MDAGEGVEPTASHYERDELPLLYPAMKIWTPAVMLRALPVFSGPQSLDLPDVQEKWHVAPGSHRAVRFWRPDRPLDRLRRMLKMDAGAGLAHGDLRAYEAGELLLLYPAMKLVAKYGAAPSSRDYRSRALADELHGAKESAQMDLHHRSPEGRHVYSAAFAALPCADEKWSARALLSPPRRCERRALLNELAPRKLWSRRALLSPPSACHADALLNELRPR